jgi:hypothetical protein
MFEEERWGFFNCSAAVPEVRHAQLGQDLAYRSCFPETLVRM